jgi:hypothetical protein
LLLYSNVLEMNVLLKNEIQVHFFKRQLTFLPFPCALSKNYLFVLKNNHFFYNQIVCPRPLLLLSFGGDERRTYPRTQGTHLLLHNSYIRLRNLPFFNLKLHHFSFVLECCGYVALRTDNVLRLITRWIKYRGEWYLTLQNALSVALLFFFMFMPFLILLA